MPELPEVELIRRDISKVFTGKKITDITVIEPYSLIYEGKRFSEKPDSEKFIKKLIKGRYLVNVGRKGKLLILSFTENVYLVIHLKMTGRLLIKEEGFKFEKHDRIVFRFGKKSLVFNDIRKFGYVEIVLGKEKLKEKLKNYGPDVLNELKSADELYRIVKKSSINVKKLLMDQKKVSGIGNAYADEILFEAGINPLKQAKDLNKKEVEKLFYSIKKKIDEGIESGGLTLRDYRNAYGDTGKFQEKLAVYGKEGLSCIKCGNSIRKVKISGRSSYFCDTCQK